MRLWTWQSTDVAHALSAGREYQTCWDHVQEGGLPAYRAMAEAMAQAGIASADSPPVWLWCDEPDAETVADRAFQVSREGDAQRGLVVLTIEAPDTMTLLTSYSGWCERLADPASRRALDPAPELGPTDMQACLPMLRPEWVTACVPLPVEAVLMDDEHAARA